MYVEEKKTTLNFLHLFFYKTFLKSKAFYLPNQNMVLSVRLDVFVSAFVASSFLFLSNLLFLYVYAKFILEFQFMNLS